MAVPWCFLVGSKFCKQVWQRFGVLSVLLAGGSPARRVCGIHGRRGRQPGAACGGRPGRVRRRRAGIEAARDWRPALPVHEPGPRQRGRRMAPRLARAAARLQTPDRRRHGLPGRAAGGDGGRLHPGGPGRGQGRRRPRSSPPSMPAAPASQPASSRRPWSGCAQLGAAPAQRLARPVRLRRCYEVPGDCATTWPPRARRRSTTSWGTPGLDLPAGARSQLQDAGVDIEYSGPCTLENEDLFSYRRTRTPDGSPDWCGRPRGMTAMSSR